MEEYEGGVSHDNVCEVVLDVFILFLLFHHQCPILWTQGTLGVLCQCVTSVVVGIPQGRFAGFPSALRGL